MPPVQGNDGEEGLSQALACTALGASQVDNPSTVASVASKDQPRHISAGGMFQTSVVHLLCVWKKFLWRPYQYFFNNLGFIFVIFETLLVHRYRGSNDFTLNNDFVKNLILIQN